MKRTIQKGFTLIELMIVIAIIGILAAIAIPQYQDYTKRAKVSEVINAVSPCKLAVSEYYSATNGFPSSLASAGCDTVVTTAYVSSVAVGAGGVITATSKVSGAAGTLIFTPIPPNGTTVIASVDWGCAVGTIDPKFVPSSCRAAKS